MRIWVMPNSPSQFDGKQLGGTFTATASHAAGVSQDFVFKGDWAPGAHTVSVGLPERRLGRHGDQRTAISL